MILLIDNYDSFSYNLYQYIGELTPDIRVIRNDEMTIEEIRALNPERIVISPGPGRPENAGIICQLTQSVSQTIPTLGVCLGHQAICMSYGGVVTYAPRLMHGKQSVVTLDRNCPLFKDVDEQTPVARYHSLAVDVKTVPACLKITARANDDGSVMAVEHVEYPIFGVQFHPESILTPFGKKMLENFLHFKPNHD